MKKVEKLGEQKLYLCLGHYWIGQVVIATIVFVWLRNGANKTKAFVKGLLVPEIKIVGGST